MIEGRNIGEANKLFLLFTRELGMIDATAQAVREGKSKLRHSLRDFSFSECGLVHGRHGWKITGAVQSHNLFDDFRGQKGEKKEQKLLLVAHIFSLLKRLVAGEGQHGSLFALLEQAFIFLKDESLTPEEIKNTECVLVLAILHELGYVQKEIDFTEFVGEVAWSKSLVSALGPLRPKILRQINTSRKESQM